MTGLGLVFAGLRSAGRRADVGGLARGRVRWWLAVSGAALAFLGATGVAGANWPQYGYDAAHTGYNPTANAITPSNVATLTVAWQTGADGDSAHASPAIANGMVYLDADNARLYAFPESCGTGDATCEPSWEATNVYEQPAAFDGSVYAVGGPAVYPGLGPGLFAFAESASGSTCTSGTPPVCSPRWSYSTKLPVLETSSAPTIADGEVYTSGGWYAYPFLSFDTVYGFPANLSSAGGLRPKVLALSTDGLRGGRAYFPPPASASGVALAGGSAYVTDQGQLWAMPTNCLLFCDTPRWVASENGWGRCPTAPANCTPVVDSADGVVFVTTSDGNLIAYSVTNGAELWSAAIPGGGQAASPAVANGVVYVGEPNPGGAGAQLYAFAATGCGAGTCTPLWSGTTTGSQITVSPTIAGGVVYVGTSGGTGELDAFPAAGCGSATCSPLFTFSLPAGVNVTTPASITNRSVYVVTDSPTAGLYALSLPSETPGGPDAPGPQ